MIEIPESESGEWRTEHFEVTADEIAIFNMRLAFEPGGGARMMKPGKYTRLMRGREVIMSDTPAEMRDLWPLRDHVTGRVLINGLGLGCAVRMALAKDGVESVEVIEKSEDVIKLCGFKDPRLTIHHACAFEFQPMPKERWDVAWHDIWDYICADNLPEMHKLHRKYGRRVDWQGSWCRAECEWHR